VIADQLYHIGGSMAVITYKALEKMKGDGKLHLIQWPPVRGLYMQITPAGYKSWVIRGKLNGKAILRTLGPFQGYALSEAETDGRRWKQQIDAGQDPAFRAEVPAPDPEPERTQLKTVWAEFDRVQLPAKALTYQHEVRRYWEKHIGPEFGEMNIVDIDSGVVNRFLDDRTHSVSNVLLGIISNLYKFAKRYYPKETWDNPTEGRVRYPGGITDRRLRPEETALWATAWVKSRSTYKYMMMWLLLTGSREGVLLKYKPEWRIEDDRLVFSGSEPGLKGALYVVVPSKAQCLMDKIKKVDRPTLWQACQGIAADAGIPPLSPHDLRRSFATFAVDIGEPDDVIESLLNHLRGKITRAYLKRNVDPLVAPANRIADHIVDLLGIDVARWI